TNGAIKIKLPDIQQPDEYSCGTAALMSIVAYYGLEPADYDKLKKKLGANERTGTDYKRMLRFAKRQGVQTEAHKESELAGLVGFLDEGKPVICSIQGYDPVQTGAKREKIYREENENGHFVVAIGYDDDNIFFMDPSLTGRRGFLPRTEFEERWHDD